MKEKAIKAKLDNLKTKIAILEESLLEKAAKPQSGSQKKKDQEPSPYEIRREESIDVTKSFAEDAFDNLMGAIDSLSIFKERIKLLLTQEAYRIDPEGAKSLIALANEIEELLKPAYDKVEDLMLALEAGRLG